ncbi:hypothetical protein SAY86_014597 [Trapa natans]|uniref:Uncharacterized protein n=1 Tax=Trapa natans TaxID=22666 RepID=A0AAN7QG24_TRANT|nr:hypothetical protein SAY86_014597 [Trapa natans]
MGNSIGRGRRRRMKKTKVMKVNGEILKLKTPVRAWEVTKGYPGHVLMDSEAVKHFGIRAQPLEPQQELKPKKIYLLLELPNRFPQELYQYEDDDDDQKDRLQEGAAPCRRVRSGINMTAKDRLECLMLSRRSFSDLSISTSSVVKPSMWSNERAGAVAEQRSSSNSMQVKLRIPRAQLDKLMECSDGVGVAKKIFHIYMTMNSSQSHHHEEPPQGNTTSSLGRRSISNSFRVHQNMQKRVSFNIMEDIPKPSMVPHLAQDSAIGTRTKATTDAKCM